MWKIYFLEFRKNAKNISIIIYKYKFKNSEFQRNIE